ncbi:IQCG [Branchiostoma lanceolatum]|uniref:Dynein regulatory complex protein 9 n=1 Tax=Branchiostoma lanceolatum TaxID=7740 RepID=A0A8J9Z068_BRALA|nr:IQCG [Branchiostoma lanceolatum]
MDPDSMGLSTPADVLQVATVLEDCVDQLVVLGKIMPVSYEGRPDADEIVGDEIGRIVDSQRQLEQQFSQLMTARQDTKFSGAIGKTNRLMQLDQDITAVSGGLKGSNQFFTRSLKQSPLTSDNLEKIQADRAFVESVMVEAQSELAVSGTFLSLLQSVLSEREKKANLQQTILREEEGRKRIKQLQRLKLEVRKEKEVEIQNRNEMIAHLKDQLQEMKAKTNMEGKYVKKNTEVQVFQTQKHCSMSEQALREELEALKVKIDEEVRVNGEIESFLKTHQRELEEKVEYWMEKYDKDVDAKQHELDVLKASKAQDLARLQELTKLYGEYEQVVVEDRIEKEKARRKAEQEAIELQCATKLQAWWRGVMVRKGLGPYKKGKKGKKGKKKSGKKGKKKKK